MPFRFATFICSRYFNCISHHKIAPPCRSQRKRGKSKGTLVWKKYEIVLDIPEGSKNITFGILLDGPGQAWVNGFDFEVVTEDVPVTAKARVKTNKEPLSLGFEN